MVPSRKQRLIDWAVTSLLLFGICVTWALAIGRYGGPDETGHVIRAAAVADGQIIGATVPGLVTGFRAETVAAPLATGDPSCYRHDKRVPSTCADGDSHAVGLRRVASSAGTNAPWYYAAVGLPVRLISETAVVDWYRIFAAALFAGTIGAAMMRVRRTSADNGVIVIVAAISPVVWFLGGVVNPSSMEIALALLAWTGVERLRTAGCSSVSELVWISVPCGIAVIIRPVSAVFVATVLVVIWLFRRPARSTIALSRRAWAVLMAGPFVGVVASFVWSRVTSVAVSDSRAAMLLPLTHVFWQSLTGTADTLHEIGGSLGWLEFSAPSVVQWLWWLMVVSCGWAAMRSATRPRLAWLFVLASVILFPIAFETALAGRLGFIWQGRYSIPTAVGLVVLGSSNWSSAVLRRRALTMAALVAAGVLELTTLWTALRRYTVGTNGSWFFTNTRWHPPASPWLLIAANAILFAGLIATGLGQTTSGSPGGVGHLATNDVES